MYAKLFVSVFVMSDTGSVATTAFTTDLPMQQCQAISKQDLNRKQDLLLQGHNATIIVKSYCEPMRGMVPPPVAGMIENFIGGLR
jgi:hypothetical protein